MSRFQHAPTEPASEKCKNAYYILRYAHDTASGLLDTFEQVRTARKAKGAPTDEEQDLLRAMLAFASAGLDSMVKQLIRDSLWLVIRRNEGAHAQFKTFVERRIKRKDGMDHGFLAGVLTSATPRQVLASQLIAELTGESLQARETLLKAISHFDIPSSEITSDLGLLDRIFRARNEIVHEMDIDFTHVNRNRRSRRRDDMLTYADELFRISDAVLSRVDIRCAPKK